MKKIKDLLNLQVKRVLLLSELEIARDDVLEQLVGDLTYEQSYNVETYNSIRYVVIGDNHPNISFIVLRLKNPFWIDTST
jgi:hypothetical protein